MPGPALTSDPAPLIGEPAVTVIVFVPEALNVPVPEASAIGTVSIVRSEPARLPIVPPVQLMPAETESALPV